MKHYIIDKLFHGNSQRFQVFWIVPVELEYIEGAERTERLPKDEKIDAEDEEEVVCADRCSGWYDDFLKIAVALIWLTMMIWVLI